MKKLFGNLNQFRECFLKIYGHRVAFFLAFFYIFIECGNVATRGCVNFNHSPGNIEGTVARQALPEFSPFFNIFFDQNASLSHVFDGSSIELGKCEWVDIIKSRGNEANFVPEFASSVGGFFADLPSKLNPSQSVTATKTQPNGQEGFGIFVHIVIGLFTGVAGGILGGKYPPPVLIAKIKSLFPHKKNNPKSQEAK